MYGPFPIATPVYADAINEPGSHVKRPVRVLDIPCETRSCDVVFPPDVEIYNLQDALIFSDTLSFIVTCPAGRVCPPGSYPRVVTFPPGTFVIPDPRVNPGFPITIQLTGCQSTVSRVLPSTATNAEINAAAQEVIQEVARQQAECDSIVNPPVPNPGPFFSNVETYASVPCEECEALVYDGILPWYISVDNENNRLVLATGVITAATQELADQQAQEFLNNFKAAADAAGKLLCETCIISTASPLPNGNVGSPYSETLTATGTVDTPSWSVVSGTLPDGLSLNSATGEISGTPTTEQTATFTIRSTAGAQCCEKEFELEVAGESCGTPESVEWIGNGFSTTGFNPTILNADMYDGQLAAGINQVVTGFWVDVDHDGTPKVATVSIQWGGPGLVWFISYEADSTDSAAFGGNTSGITDATTKTINVPIYPNSSGPESNYVLIFAVGSLASYGDAICSFTYDCVGITDLLAIAWGAPNLNIQGAATAAASGTGTNFSIEMDNPGAPGDGASPNITGTFTVNGNGVAAKLTLTFSNYITSGTFPRFSIVATSSIDGIVWNCFTDNGAWFTGNGVYEIPFVIGCTPGAVISVLVEIEDSAGIGVGSMTVSGAFSVWS